MEINAADGAVQLKTDAEAELKTAQEGCAQVLAVLDARDRDVWTEHFTTALSISVYACVYVS